MEGGQQSEEARRALAQAKDLAAKDGVPPDSMHVLRALCVVSTRARSVLATAKLDAQAMGEAWPAPVEPPLVFARLEERARDIADSAGAKRVDCLHLLVVLLRTREGRAFGWLEHKGHQPSRLRQAAVAAMAQEAAAWSQQAASNRQMAHEAAPNVTRAVKPLLPRPALPPRKSPAEQERETQSPRARRVTRKPDRTRRKAGALPQTKRTGAKKSFKLAAKSSQETKNDALA